MTILEEAQLDVKIWPQLRLGQCVFNTAYHRNPKVVNTLAGTDVDPFYDDSKIDAFLARLRELGVQ